jgi:hypothetical protein
MPESRFICRTIYPGIFQQDATLHRVQLQKGIKRRPAELLSEDFNLGFRLRLQMKPKADQQQENPSDTAAGKKRKQRELHFRMAN